MINLKGRLARQVIVVLGLLGTTGFASAQNWVNQSDMKVARVEATSVDYRDDIYVFNGFKPGIKIANSVEKYDAATKKWSIVSSTSTLNGTAVTHNGVVRVGADVWIIGGRIGSHPGRVSDKVWIYNLNNSKWRAGPELPTPGAAGGAALVDNKVHWFGGVDSNARCDVSRHLVYDLDSPSAGWDNITANAGMPSPRNHFSTAVVGGIIYAMGGQYGHDRCPGKTTEDTALVHAFDPDTNKWTRKADMPKKNSHSEPGTFVYKGNIYTTGGETVKNKVWKYNPRSNKWSTFKTLSDDLIAPIARIIDGRLIVAGGGAPVAQQATNTVRSLLVDNNPSTQEPEPAPEPTPVQEPEPTPEPTPVQEPEPTPEPTPVQEPEPTPEPTPVQDPAPTPEPTPVQDPAPTQEPAPIQEPAPTPEPTVNQQQTAGSDKPASATLISMEAEYFDVSTKTSTHQWVHVARGNSSNDDAMITTPDQGDLAGSTENTPMLSYMVYFNSPGKHYIWIRGSGDSNESGIGNSDSIHVGLNGTVADTAYRIDQFPAQWTWSRHTPSNPVASLNVVNAGVNMVNFWMREDGLAIDKFVITSDPDFVPADFGPEVSDGSEGYVAPASSDDINANPVNDDPVQTDVTETGDSTPITDEASSGDPAATDSVSKNGILGGSASITALFALLLICAGRSRRIRLT